MVEGSAGTELSIRRRRRSAAERRRIIAESFELGSSVSVVARRHDMNTKLLFTWRRRYAVDQQKAASASGVVPAVVLSRPEATSASDEAIVDGCASQMSGRMEIELPGGSRLVVWRDVDTAVLGRVVRTLVQG